MTEYKKLIYEDYNKVKQQICTYESKIKDSPAGSLEIKCKNEKRYYYKKYRDKETGKIKSEYIGCDLNKIGKIIKSYENKRKYKEILKEKKAELKEIEKTYKTINQSEFSSRHTKIRLEKKNIFISFIYDNVQYEIKSSIPCFCNKKNYYREIAEEYRRNKIAKIKRNKLKSEV